MGRTPEIDTHEFLFETVNDGRTIEILDHGHVTLERVGGCDLDIVNAAKVSFAKRAPEVTAAEKGLLRYLMRERHGSPFEHGYLHFTVRMPLYVFYEMHRHRSGHSYNEESGRYTEMRDDYYCPHPTEMRQLVPGSKPGHYLYQPMQDPMVASDASDMINMTQRFCFRNYKLLLEMGVAKEQARIVLPQGMYKEQVWTCNPRSFMHFLSLRMDRNAQREIRMMAHAAYHLVRLEGSYTHTLEAFEQMGFVAP